MLHNRLGRTLLLLTPVSPWPAAWEPSAGELASIAAAVHAMRLPVTGNMGMDAAQVTAGGIATEEFDPRTMQSRLVPGLYAAGEVLDIDGDCGGYNLQWAWSSGHLAGQLRKGGRARCCNLTGWPSPRATARPSCGKLSAVCCTARLRRSPL